MDRESPWKELRERSRPPAVRLPIIGDSDGINTLTHGIENPVKLYVTVEIMSKYGIVI